MDGAPILPIIFYAILFALVVGGVVWWFNRSILISSLTTIGCLVLLVGGIVLTWPEPVEPAIQPEPAQPMHTQLATFEQYRPTEVPDNGYVGAEACRECHQENHASWYASYHRTMTQVATPEAVLGDFDNVHVTAKGRDYRLSREGEVCWVEMNDADLPPSPETRMDLPIVMTTGSHHMQIYWFASGVPRTLGQLPIVYLKETKQWIPRSSAFLEPPDTPVSSEVGRWNESCSTCHSTHQRERRRIPATYDTQVAEFGISCEACHGPGQQHIAAHRQSTTAAVADDPIVNPSSLSHREASQVCGQCHSVHSNREDKELVREQGHGYRPGQELTETHHIWQRDSEVVKRFLDRMQFEEGSDEALRKVFWDDGMVRVSGREFNGLVESACYQHGEMSCLSCHQMHKESSDSRSLSQWADDQLSPVGTDDRACLQCHAETDYGVAHTHHPVQSSGARCYNCHMPHTTYGLLKAIRSHTISSPSVEKDLAARRPNACNLCHLDKTLDWTAQTMNQWYGSPLPELSEDQTRVAASLIWLLKGDAGERALAAWNMGWQDAHEASGTDWISPLLAQLLNDPYDAVRFVARRSMLTLPGFENLPYNALSPEAERMEVIDQVLQKWHSTNAKDRSKSPAILIDESGVQMDQVKQLIDQRDNRRVVLIE